MNTDRRPCVNKSRNLAAIMLGVLALLWAPIPFLAPSQFRMVYVVNSYGVAWVWCSYLALCGALILIGVLWPWRKAKLIGLGLSFLGWSAFVTMYLRDMSYSPSMISMAVYALMSAITLISDVRRKPRVPTD